ncbi:hypothetical protein BG005_001198 [Podila minutissima]|nr:hypothetical protein BG005_001198 [Podila minutissima]
MSTPRPSEEGHISGTSSGNNIAHIPRHPHPHPHHRPHFNNSFDQPTEPFECDVSAILPYDDDEDEDDDDEDEQDEDEDEQDEDEEEEEDVVYSHPPNEERETRPSLGHMKDHRDRGSNPENNLAKYQHASTKEGSSHDDRLQPRYLQVEPEWVYEDPYPNQPYLDDDQIGGHTRLSTIAEMSEMPSINITNSQDKPRPDSKNKNFKTRPEVISRDLVLEDLFVDGEREEEAHRQELLANLKPNDILGPIHETRGFHISSLTGQRNSRAEQERDEPVQEREGNGQDQEEQEQSRESTQRCYQDSIEEALENDMDESALALKREFERMFGPKGAVDSERSGSDVGLEAYDNSEDLYGAHEEDEEGEDDDDVFFANDDDEVDEQEEEYYAMLDLNGGDTNMILGNNIPRKPKVLAPPPGSRLPIPRFAQTATPPASVNNKPTLPSGLRPPQVIAKAISPPPEPREPTPPVTKSGSILEGLWNDLAEHDSIPEQSPGAIFAAQVAAELLKEEREKKPEIRPRGLRPPQVRSKLREDIGTVTQSLKVESIPPVEVATQSTIPRPTTISSIPSRVPGLPRSAIPPPKVRSAQPISPQTSANGGNASGTKTPTPTIPSLSRLPIKLASRPSSQSPVRSLGSPRSSPQSSSPTPTQSPRAPSRAQLQERPSTQKQKPSTPPSGSEFRKSTSVYQERSPAKGENVTSTPRASGSRPFDQYARSSQINREVAKPKEERDLNRVYSPEPVARAHHQGEDRNLARLQRKLQLQKELQEIEEEEKVAEMQRRRNSTDRPKLSVRTESRTGRGHEYPHDHRHRRLSSERLDSGSPLSPLSPRSPLSSKVLSPRSSAYLGDGYKRSSIYDVKDGHRLSREGHLVPTLEESCKQLAKIRQEIVELRKEVLQVSGSLATQQGSSSSSKQLTRQAHFPDRRDSVDSKYYVHGTRSQLGHFDSLQSSSEPSSPEIMSTIVATPRRKMIGDILGKFRRSVMNPPAPSGTDSNHVIVVDIVVRSWP